MSPAFGNCVNRIRAAWRSSNCIHDGQQVDDAAWPLPPGTATHPRTAGTFARTLRRYVREDGAMDVTEAIRRSATLPALTLQEMSPAMRRKGRLQVNADADIVVFDLQP